MSVPSFEIRLCQNPECGLRYPLVKNNIFGDRCPVCLGETQIVLTQDLLSPNKQYKGKLPRNRIKYALLDNIRSAGNVGSIFRTTDGLGMEKLYLCGITPTPENEVVRKTSMRTEIAISWEYTPNAVEMAIELKSDGFSLIALEQDERAIDIGATRDLQLQNIVIIVGNEVTGVDPELIKLCDQIIQIPMYGSVSCGFR